MNTTITEVGDDRRQRIISELRVEPGAAANLVGRDTGWTGGGEFDQLSAAELDGTAKAILAAGVEQLADAQELTAPSSSTPSSHRTYSGRPFRTGSERPTSPRGASWKPSQISRSPRGTLVRPTPRWRNES